jgi:hypothetical protein
LIEKPVIIREDDPWEREIIGQCNEAGEMAAMPASFLLH